MGSCQVPGLLPVGFPPSWQLEKSVRYSHTSPRAARSYLFTSETNPSFNQFFVCAIPSIKSCRAILLS